MEFSKKTHRPIIIIAQDFEAEALTTMVVNKLQNALKIVAVKAPIIMGKEYMEDIAIFTGANMISTEMGHVIEQCDPVYFMGKCNKVQIDAQSSTFIGGQGKPEDI
jgi:chaperonin GroEL